MVDDPNPGLRTELQAAITLVEPQIAALENLGKLPLSGASMESLNSTLATRRDRLQLLRNAVSALDNVVAAMTALEAQGYPALEPMTVVHEIFAEIDERRRQIELAASVFAEALAASMTIDLGDPAPKAS